MIRKSKCSPDKDCHGEIPTKNNVGETIWLYYYSDGPPDFGHYYLVDGRRVIFPELTLFDRIKRFWITHAQIRKMTFLGSAAHKARWKNK